MADSPRKYRWLDLIYSAHGPPDPIDRLLLSAIAKCMNPDGRGARPSHARLAEMCGFKNRKTPLRRLRRLEGVWFERRRSCGKSGEYSALFPNLSQAGGTPPVPSEGDTPCPTQEGHVFSISPSSPAAGRANSPEGGRGSRPAAEQLPIPRFALQLEEGGSDERVAAVWAALKSDEPEDFDKACAEIAAKGGG